MKAIFFELEPWEKKKIEETRAFEHLGVTSIMVDKPLNKDHLPKDLDAEIVSVFVGSIVDKKVIKAFPKLKFIAARSTGYDHIDISECNKRKIKVAYVPCYGERTVAEYAFALLLTISRKIFTSYHQVRETGSFDQENLRGFDLFGKTLGVVGTGNIGRNIIRIAKGFGMKVVAIDPHPDKKFAAELGFKYMSLEEVLSISDVVTLHVPYVKSTHHLINFDTIRLFKHGAVLINTSRGPVVETEALVSALKDGTLAGAGLDVLEEEGIIKDELSFITSGHPEEYNLRTVLANHILIDLPNVIVTPHNAFNTTDALARILNTTFESIVSFVQGKPVNLVK